MKAHPDLTPCAAVAVMRTVRDWNQRELAEAAGVQPSTVSDWERGKKVPTLRTLERLAGVMGFPPVMVQRALAFIREGRQALGPVQPGDLSLRIEELAAEFGKETAEFVRAGLTRLTAEAAALQERCRAPYLWERLRQYGPSERRAVVQETPEFWNWALCELVCEESVKAAADNARRARDLAELALVIASRIPGEEIWRSRIQGYAWAFVANARRVGGDLPGADEAFSTSEELWSAGDSGGFPLLDESRRLDLAASLRRAQRRLPESLGLLERALALGKQEAAGRILILKAKTLEELGDPAGALAALRRAAPLVDEETNPRDALCIRFNVLVYLVAMGRFAEASSSVPEVRSFTTRLGNALDLNRLLWLEGQIAAGLGKAEEALMAFRHVRAAFAAREIAYDTALVTLEMSGLLASLGRTREVKDLARHLAPVFQAQGVHREALAALAVFRKAAEEERLTVDLAQRILRFLKEAREKPDLQFTG